MTYPHHPGPHHLGFPPGSWPYPPPTSGTHDNLALGTTLGQLLAGQDRQLFLQELIVAELRALPERIAALIPTPPPPPPPGPTLSDHLAAMREILKLMIPLGLIALVAMGRLTVFEGEGLIRKWLGLG